MTMRLALIFAATALASASALAQGQAAAPKAEGTSQAVTPEKFLEGCAARKFETTIEVDVGANKRGRKMTLCGKKGQTDADWVRTLKDAARKIEASTMRPEAKEQAVMALNAEIAKVESAKSAARASAPAVGAVLTATPRADYSSLSPVAGPSQGRVEYSTLPPIPAPPKMAAKSSPASPAPAVKKPRLTIKCLAPGEKGAGGTCDFLEPETRLAIRADEDMESSATLRFLRRGDARGEVELAQLRQGQSMRTRLPSELCKGVAKAKVEIQVVGGKSQVLDTLGPYGMRC